jgi:hypothetical protein
LGQISDGPHLDFTETIITSAPGGPQNLSD